MKNGKRPTLENKKIIKSHGLDPYEWLVVKDLPNSLEIVNRKELKKNVIGRRKTKIIDKSN